MMLGGCWGWRGVNDNDDDDDDDDSYNNDGIHDGNNIWLLLLIAIVDYVIDRIRGEF
jgi:hypothetical protein